MDEECDDAISDDDFYADDAEREERIFAVIHSSTQNVLADVAWRCFGYAKRPRGGHFWSRFRTRWKVDLENRLARNLMCTPIAAHIISRTIIPFDIFSVLERTLDGTSVHLSLGYASEEEAKPDLYEIVASFENTPVTRWGGELLKHLDVQSIPHRETALKLVGGAAKYVQICEQWTVAWSRHNLQG